VRFADRLGDAEQGCVDIVASSTGRADGKSLCLAVIAAGDAPGGPWRARSFGMLWHGFGAAFHFFGGHSAAPRRRHRKGAGQKALHRGILREHAGGGAAAKKPEEAAR